MHAATNAVIAIDLVMTEYRTAKGIMILIRVLYFA
jgi:hypothetical protein